MTRQPCGLVVLDKPTGMTSRAAVDVVARSLRRVKVGHAGTLDPLASGVLVVGVGSATRLIEYVQRMPKAYRTVVRLGATSDTLDADGQVVEAIDPRVPTMEEIEAAVAGQVGTILQVPPRFSALKVDGRRAYDLARAGREVALEARPVQIQRIEILSYDWPRLELAIDCGSGTYIRSIARDVGEAIGCGGLVDVLVRTRIGPYTLREALDPAELTIERLLDGLRPAAEAIAGLPRAVLTAEQVALVRRGSALDGGRLAGGPPPGGEVALIGPDGELVALAEHDPGSGLVQPRRVLVAG